MMGIERVTADVKIIPRIIHVILEDPKKESKGTTHPLGESVSQLVRPSINASSQMFTTVAERAWEESSFEKGNREKQGSLSLLLIVDLDRSTINRRTDPFDRLRR